MKNLKQKVHESASFYKDSFLNFDFQLAELNFRSFKPYFKGKNALELGPAIGQMTKKIVTEFESVDLLEGVKELLDEIPEYPNVVKHHSMFEDFVTDKKYDTIIMGHVLEHIYNPIEVCTDIFKWLADDGVFIVSVPNAKSIHRLAAKEMQLIKSEYELNQRDHDLGHYRVYDMELLKADLIAAGFKIKDSGGIFFKPLSNGQIEENWTQEMIEGFYQLGKQFPEYCAEIFVICTK